METLEVLPIRVKVTAILRKALLSGEYEAGDELSLTDVAAQLGVSRTPVREAFQALAAEGLLELRMNRGAIVKGINETFIRDHFELRALLESEAARRAAAAGMDTTPLLNLQREAETGSMTESEYRNYNQQLHTEIWLAAGNRKMYDLLVSLWNGPSGRSIGRDRDHELTSIREHQALLECIAGSDADGASRIMKAHIIRSMENILTNFQQAMGGKKH